MEAPQPVFFTPIPLPEKKAQIDIKDVKMVEIKSFEIELTKKKFTLELAKSENNENIILKSYCNKEKKLKYYIKILELKEFYILNNFFSYYQSIKELYTLLFQAIDKKKFSVNIKENLLILTLEFILPGEKVIDIHFELREEKIKNEELMELMNEMTEKLNEENKLIKEDINNLKTENKNLKEQLKNNDEEFNKIKNILNNAINEIKKVNEENIEIKEKI